MNLTRDQQRIYNVYLYENYVSKITSPLSTLSIEEILHIEKLTRGQSENDLWNALRLDRQTASSSCATHIKIAPTAAMSYGLLEEKTVKKNKSLMTLIENSVSNKLGLKIINVVLDCGLFFSKHGLYSASPDAYIEMENQVFVPIEIKCPLTYKDTTADEVRNGMNVRRKRYRIKHTAYSVNPRGRAIYAIEKTDPHYRQMQRQMYVLNAPICVYVVKFKNSFVCSIVDRDEEFCNNEYKKELNIFNMYLGKNLAVARLKRLSCRLSTFETNNHNYNEEQVKRLTDVGFYYNYGNLTCVHCNKSFETDILCDTILDHLHPFCNYKITYKHSDYMNHDKRLTTIPNNIAAVDKGVFRDSDGSFKTFCCDTIVNNLNNVSHTNQCSYAKLLHL